MCIYEINLTTLLFTTQAIISLPSLFLLLFIYSFEVVVIITAATIATAACLCMLENKANACTLLQSSKQANERANQFLITKNAKYTIERKSKRERELLSTKEKISKH